MSNVILVTGGSGMVGKALEEYCSLINDSNNRWIFLSSKDADLTDRNSVFTLFEKHRPTYVIHLAAKVGGLYYNMKEGPKMFTDNVRMNENMLEACHKFNVQRGIFCLSTCIFPANPSKFPMVENMLHESAPHPSNEGYGYSKRMLEIQCRAYNKTYGREYMCVIPVNLYGPHDNFNLENSHVIPGLIHKFYLAQKNNTDIVIPGAGGAFRQFIYSKDFAKILYEIFSRRDKIDSMICSNDEVTVKDIICKIKDCYNFTGNLVFDTGKPEGCLKKTASNEYFLSIFPDFKFTKLEDGLRETVKWFTDNYGTHVRL